MICRFALLTFIALGMRADLLVTSAGTDSVLRYDAATGAFLGTFVASGSGGTDEPKGIAVAANGDVLVSSFNTDQILRYSAIGAFLGALPNAGGALMGPFKLALGPGGVLYTASNQTDAILKYDAVTGSELGVFVSDATMPPLNQPRGLAVGNDRVYTSTEGDRIRYYDIVTGSLLISPFGDNPRGLTIGPDGHLYSAYAGPASLVAIHDGLTGVF